jgi:hypothetical protein
MISTSRRGFFVGLGASLIAAPSIVHAANLMPIASFDTLDWPVTPQSIADEAARLLHEAFQAPSPFTRGQVFKKAQYHADFPLEGAPPNLGGLAKRWISPLMDAIANVGHHPDFGCPPLPPICNAVIAGAVGEYRGTKVRYIEYYTPTWDTISGRFDVGVHGRGRRLNG